VAKGPEKLRRMHRSKEASGYGFITPYWRSPNGIKFVSYLIIGTMMEAVVRRWCCHVGGNNFVTRWQIVIAIRQHCSFHWLTVLSIAAEMSDVITEIAVNVVR
jgi:hypothetical protein